MGKAGPVGSSVTDVSGCGSGLARVVVVRGRTGVGSGSGIASGGFWSGMFLPTSTVVMSGTMSGAAEMMAAISATLTAIAAPRLAEREPASVRARVAYMATS